MALVDLTQPQDVLDKVRDAVKEIQAVFSHKNLFVSFMDGQNVSETIEVTDYVLENYFKSHPEQYCYLYRSILLKKREMEDHLGVWADAKKMGLIVFSDEKVYGIMMSRLIRSILNCSKRWLIPIPCVMKGYLYLQCH